jgi:hypothetical protein
MNSQQISDGAVRVYQDTMRANMSNGADPKKAKEAALGAVLDSYPVVVGWKESFESQFQANRGFKREGRAKLWNSIMARIAHVYRNETREYRENRNEQVTLNNLLASWVKKNDLLPTVAMIGHLAGRTQAECKLALTMLREDGYRFSPVTLDDNDNPVMLRVAGRPAPEPEVDDDLLTRLRDVPKDQLLSAISTLLLDKS